jgi:Bacteriophytochrome (light-regulated signal transduction histidine kinase)
MPNSNRPVWRTATQFLTTPTLARSISGLLALVVALLLVVNLGTYFMIQRTSAAHQAVARAQDARLLLRDVRSQMLSLETGQRGYLLTGDIDYLAPNFEARSELPNLIRELEALTQGDPRLEAWVARLKRTIERRVAFSDRTVELARMGQFSAAGDMVRSGRGKAMMDAMMAQVDQAEVAQAATILALNERSRLEARTTTIINALAGALILILGVVAGWLVLRYVRDMQDANAELDDVNSGLENTVRDRTSALSRANEEIQRFAYIVSHDLRAPLVNVMGYTSELERAHAALKEQQSLVRRTSPKLILPQADLAVQEDVPEAIGFIRTSTEKMDRLINAILRLSREGRRDLVVEQIDMTALVTTIAATVRHQTESLGATLEVADLPTLTSDRLSIDQIFGNLIDNAIKYLDAERPGRIEVSGEITVNGERLFRIKDNGRGISPKDHERIFELFRRAGRQDQPGEGLGLAFVRNSIRRMGGDIHVDSTLGEGSTFTLRFPADLTLSEGMPDEH